ncbi:aminotransferase class IV [Pseudomonas sp. ICMP 561]|uniref:aminotransferase class IV n=1 Tax=Pseudomonas sp. ICMP 561 TaxID=1718918 RepID=UPI000C07026A|nr:aminotransferase class IV [Pseudomonas sp. ICMP 561]PHN17157.1 Branched-chain amino acid aminotransferase [Pseudomonas sp. ICMP 561]
MSLLKVEQVMLTHDEHIAASHAPEYESGAAFTQVGYTPLNTAQIPLLDMGFIHADAAYDVVSVSRGNFFRLEEHLDRMERSCEKFALSNPYSREQTKEILHELVRLSGIKDAYVWWAVTRGVPAGPRSDPSAQKNAFYAFALPYVWLVDEETRLRGIDLGVSTFNRISPRAVDPTAKNFHWMDMKLSLFQAKKASQDWSVLLDAEDNLTEAPGSNIFIVKNGVVITPNDGCLEGVTRQSAIELAQDLGLQVELRRVHVQELLNADDAFLTSSAGGILPVRSVNGQLLNPANQVGEVAEKIHNLYWEKRWSGWLASPVNYAKVLS